MKTLTDIKRRIQFGIVLTLVENTKRPELNGQARRVTHTQGNAFTWRLVGAPETEARSWTYYAPAKTVRIIDADTFSMALTDAWGHVTTDSVTLRFTGEV
jgi:hypothetical protein